LKNRKSPPAFFRYYPWDVVYHFLGDLYHLLAQNIKKRAILRGKKFPYVLYIVSKKLLEAIISKVQQKTKCNQWRNTNTVINWFKLIPQKEKCKFMQLDIVDFYPSITSDLLTKALDFAKSITAIDNDTHTIIMHARKSLLFDKDNIWTKKSNPSFDVTMGSYDGAEICEIVGLYLLNELRTKCNDLEIGLYRDDGLGIMRNQSGPQTKRTKKKITEIFKSHGLKITIECNLQQVDFIDVTFNLQSGKFWPYRKPNNTPLYIHRESNHPPNIIKQLPIMIENRVSSISCDENEFEKAKGDYSNALKNSGFNHNLKYSKQNKATETRKRSIIWFNPPYNAKVETHIGNRFLALVDSHFPRHHRYHKIFNRNTIKLSYSCSPSMSSIISKHNRKLLSN